MDAWAWNWLFWIAGFFLAYELVAIAIGGRTLSRQVWNWFSLRQRKRYWLARRVIFVVFWLSLGIGHFLFQAPALWSVILPGIPFAAVVGLSSFVWKDATTQGAKKEQSMSSSWQPVPKLAPEYDWRVTLWKGLRPALIVAAMSAIGAFLGAIDAKTFVDLGIPQFVVLFVLEAARNWYKQHRA